MRRASRWRWATGSSGPSSFRRGNAMIGSADRIEIIPHALLIGDALAFVRHENAGADALFLGTPRAENHPESRLPLVALDYEAYTEMALPQLHTLAAAARSQWPVLKLVILHRTGRVPVGEPSVLIAVSTPH